MEKVERILHKHFSSENWTVTKPQDGLQKECYIAQSEELKVFIKFDVPIGLLQRLGQIGVAPQIIGSLWWYIPPQNWPEFFTAYGLELDESLREKIYWWSARISLAVALWCAERDYDCQSFVQDFLAAVTGGDNPHAAFQ